MSKYEKLWQYIKKNKKDNFDLTFAEIGRIAGVKLDHSFLLYKKELPQYGFKVKKISLKNKVVKFERLRK